MNNEPQLTETGPRRPSAVSARLRGGNATILAALWVAVIVLAVAIDLTK